MNFIILNETGQQLTKAFLENLDQVGALQTISCFRTTHWNPPKFKNFVPKTGEKRSFWSSFWGWD